MSARDDASPDMLQAWRMSSFAIIFSSFSSKQLTMTSKRQGEENTPSRVQHGTS